MLAATSSPPLLLIGIIVIAVVIVAALAYIIRIGYEDGDFGRRDTDRDTDT